MPLDLTHFRFAADFGTNDATKTWLADEDVSVERADGVESEFRLRVALQETGGGMVPLTAAQLEYRVNGGFWLDVAPGATHCRPVDGLRGDGSDNTVQHLSATGTFAGDVGYDDVDGSAGGMGLAVPANGHCELEFNLHLVAGSLSPDDLVEFRVTALSITAHSSVPAVTFSPLDPIRSTSTLTLSPFARVRGPRPAQTTSELRLNAYARLRGPAARTGSSTLTLVSWGRLVDGDGGEVDQAIASTAITGIQAHGQVSGPVGVASTVTLGVVAYGRLRAEVEPTLIGGLSASALSSWARIADTGEPPTDPPDIITGGLPAYGKEEFAQGFFDLLPPGRLWERLGPNVRALIRGMACEWERLYLRSLDLLSESDPRSCSETVPEWELELGLPRPCLANDPPTSAADRRAAILARYSTPHTSTPQDIIDAAAMVGVTVTLEENTPSDSELTVHAPETIVRITDMSGDMSESMAEFGNGLLECVVLDVVPAHIRTWFVYDIVEEE